MQLTDTCDTLHGLLWMADDGCRGLLAAAANVRSPSLAVLLRRQAAARATAALELRAIIASLGPADKGKDSLRAPSMVANRTGVVHTASSMAATLFGRSDHRRLLDCESRSVAALARYRLAFSSPLEAGIRETLQAQAWRAERDQEQLRSLREAAEAGRRQNRSPFGPVSGTRVGPSRLAYLMARQPAVPIGIGIALCVVGWLAWRATVDHHAAADKRT